jgi:hypothetical protein
MRPIITALALCVFAGPLSARPTINVISNEYSASVARTGFQSDVSDTKTGSGGLPVSIRTGSSSDPVFAEAYAQSGSGLGISLFTNGHVDAFPGSATASANAHFTFTVPEELPYDMRWQITHGGIGTEASASIKILDNGSVAFERSNFDDQMSGTFLPGHQYELIAEARRATLQGTADRDNGTAFVNWSFTVPEPGAAALLAAVPMVLLGRRRTATGR